jgi:hypothetical protein
VESELDAVLFRRQAFQLLTLIVVSNCLYLMQVNIKVASVLQTYPVPSPLRRTKKFAGRQYPNPLGASTDEEVVSS